MWRLTGAMRFQRGAGVQITGVWGWPAVPAPVVDACYLQAERIYQRRNSPMGVAGPNEFGQLTALAPLDPDVRMLLQPYVRMGLGAYEDTHCRAG